MKRRQLVFLLAGLAACLFAVSCSPRSQSAGDTPATPEQTVTITVSAAASLQDALNAIAPQFEAAHPNVAVDYNFASSGSLQQQIEQGAPVDVFFSAATKQMDALAEKDLIVSDSRQDIVTNSLVLIASRNSSLDITDVTQLKDAEVSRIAVGEFRSVPAGQYAEQMFTQLNLLESLQPKFVFGNSVRSVLSAVEGGNAELGIVYATDAALSDQVKVLAAVPENLHEPIVYPIAIVKNSPHAEAAQTFIHFLATTLAQQTFEEFGFGRVEGVRNEE